MLKRAKTSLTGIQHQGGTGLSSYEDKGDVVHWNTGKEKFSSEAGALPFIVVLKLWLEIGSRFLLQHSVRNQVKGAF